LPELAGIILKLSLGRVEAQIALLLNRVIASSMGKYRWFRGQSSPASVLTQPASQSTANEELA
jgi:hypothetical protein